MARKDKPYLALYVQDFITDEKLIQCSASATGVYIRLMCLLHKSEKYGEILLRQKFRQNNQQTERQSERQIKNFCLQFARSLPYTMAEIEEGLTELVNEEVITIEGDLLYQKRMVQDGELSLTRSGSGKLGAIKTNEKHKYFAAAKLTAKPSANDAANTDIDIDIDNTIINSKGNEQFVILEMLKKWMVYNPTYQSEQDTDYPALLKIAHRIAKAKNFRPQEVSNGKMKECVDSWEVIVKFIRQDDFFKKLELATIEKKWAGLYQSMNAAKEGSSKDFAKDPTKIKIKL